MRRIKQERDSSESCSGDEAVGPAGPLQGVSRDLLGHSAPSGPFKTKPSSRRKREFIPEERKDSVYWERRRKNNEAAKRSREKRRSSELELEEQLLLLGGENAALRAELLSLKVHFGLISSSDYAQQVQRLSSGPSSNLYKDPVPPNPSGDLKPLHLRSSCISVIKHSPYQPEPCGAPRERPPPCRAAAGQQEAAEGSSSPFDLYPLCLLGVYPPPPFSQTSTSSSCSPRSSEDGVVSKSSDGEDEQQVPKGLIPPHCRSVIVSTHKVPDSGSSALPHKLRIKSRTVKLEASDPEYESSAAGGSHSSGDTASSCCPLSAQVHHMKDWRGSEPWQKGGGALSTTAMMDVTEPSWGQSH